MSELQRQRLMHMAWQLNDLVVDLKTPSDVMKRLKDDLKTDRQVMALSRMVLSALFVNLCKLLEIINHYGKEIRLLPTDTGNDLRAIKLAIEEKGIYQYRNTYIAHAFAQEKGRPDRPLTLKEASAALTKIIDSGLNPVSENVFSFCEWVHKNGEPTCVVNTLHRAVLTVESHVGGLGTRT